MRPNALTSWLAGLDAADLAGILVRRSDVSAGRPPRDLAELTDRLVSRTSVANAFLQMNTPLVQVVEAFQALGPTDSAGVPRADLAALLGVSVDDAGFLAALDVLADSALIWPDGDRLHGAPPLRHAFAYPLKLGRPARELLSGRTVAELRGIAAALGVPAGSTKAQATKAVVEALGTAELVRTQVEKAPPRTRQMLREAAERGPVIGIEGLYFTGYAARLPAELAWPIERGMLVPDGWQVAEVPREVAVALRGPQWHADFGHAAPETVTTAVKPPAVARDAAASATAALDQFGAMIEACAATPAALLKAGGVGAREIRRLAKASGATEPAAKLWLVLAVETGLLEITAEGVLPTAAYDEWTGSSPAERLAGLVLGWLDLTSAPSLAGDGGRPALLVFNPYEQVGQRLRVALLQAVGGLPAGTGQRAPGDSGDYGLDDLVRWHVPMVVGSLEDPVPLIRALWSEAALLGLTGQGALSDLGRAALADDRERVTEAAGKMVAPATETARFQADLSAIVPGTPGRDLGELLDLCADRETRGAASIWRFSPGSVRRALDSGQSTSELLDRLRAVSAAGALPQPLEYLFGDVARRHGSLRVRAVKSAIRSDDTALLAELVVAKALRPLGLALLAPTVAVSGKPVDETLRALRAASYAPVHEDATGAIVVERAVRRRSDSEAPRPVKRSAPRTGEPTPDPLALAKALLAAPLETPSAPAPRSAPASLAKLDRATLERMISGEQIIPGMRTDLGMPDPWSEELTEVDSLSAEIGFHARHLPADEVRLLAGAIAEGYDVTIGYRDRGDVIARPIGDIELTGDRLNAWCYDREGERVFRLRSIETVTPY